MLKRVQGLTIKKIFQENLIVGLAGFKGFFNRPSSDDSS